MQAGGPWHYASGKGKAVGAGRTVARTGPTPGIRSATAAPSPRRAKKSADDKPASSRREPEPPLTLGPLADFVGFHLRLAQEASFQAFARRVRAIDLRPGRFAIMALIAENRGLSQTALGRISGRDKSSLTPALDDLERRGLIRRRRLPTDRRSYALALTTKGSRLLQKLIVHARAHDRGLDEIVGLDNKAEFIAILRRIATALA